MSYLLNLYNSIKNADNMITYHNEINENLKNKLCELKIYLDEKYKEKFTHIEGELFSKLEEEKERLEGQVAEMKRSTSSDYEYRIQSLKKEKEKSLAQINELIEQESVIVREFLSSKNDLLEKVKSLKLSNEIKSVFTSKDIIKFDKKELSSTIEHAIYLKNKIMEIELSDLPNKVIDKDILFPVTKLEIKNKDVEILLRFLNLVILVGLFVLYSKFITLAALVGVGYVSFKNYKNLKGVNESKDYVLSLIQLEAQLFENIRKRNNDKFVQEIKEIENKISSFENELKNKLNSIEEHLDSKKRELENEYASEKAKKLEELRKDLEKEMREFSNELENAQNSLDESFIQFKNNIIEKKAELERIFNELNEFEINVVNNKELLDLKRFHLGYEMTEEMGEIKYFEDLPFSSMLFVYGEDKGMMRDLMKYITLQFASRLKGNLLKINILDPIEYGEGFSELVYEKNIDQFYSRDEVQEKVKDIIEKFTRDIKNIFTGYSSIMEYNTEKVTNGSTPYPYTLNLIQNVDVFSDIPKYKQMLQTTKNGVINLVLISNELINEVKKSVQSSDLKNAEFLDFLLLFGKIFTFHGTDLVQSGNLEESETYEVEDTLLKEEEIAYVYDKNQILDQINKKYSEPFNFEIIKDNSYMPIPKTDKDGNKDQTLFVPISLTPHEFREYGKQIHENIQLASSNIFYFKDFLNHIIKKGGRFNFDNTKGLLLPLGYKDGDVEKLTFTKLDDEIIHYYMAGRTGMGKSNTLNSMINALLNMYTPEQLEIYYIDFKVIEGKKYMRNPTPHFKCISVSSDPYYLISLYRHLEKELQYRQNVLIPKYNAGKVEDIRKQGIAVPAILVIVDEVGEGFKSDDADLIKEVIDIMDSLSRLGRASDFHLIYTSQDVSEKIPEGMINQFSGRIALPVRTRSESKRVINNDHAADPEYQNKGDLLLNTRNGDEKANIRIRVPLIEPWDMDENLESINKELKSKYPMQCVLFSEEEECSIKELDNYLSNMKPGNTSVILGGNAQFSTKPYPVGFNYEFSNSNNILVLSQGKKRRIELLNTVLKNIVNSYKGRLNIVLLRGNRDYASFDILKEYSSEFLNVAEVENLDQYMDIVSMPKLKRLEMDLKIDYSNVNLFEENSGLYEYLMENVEDFPTYWENKIKTLERDEPFPKNFISDVIEFVRPKIPVTLAVIEGLEEIEGIGFGYADLKEINPIINYSPYFNLINIWTASTLPPRFDTLSNSFRHKLIGSLDSMDEISFKFMRDSKDHYGGYYNSIKPSASFKFKIFRLDNVNDDESTDNKIRIDLK